MNLILKKMQEIKAQNKHIYPRDIAAQLGISEAELLHAQIGENVTKLDCRPEEILVEMPAAGKLMALTRNESCVLERDGIYPEGQFMNKGSMKMALLVSWEVDLRLFLHHWAYAYAVENKNYRKSIQFFDRDGAAVHKIYATEEANTDVFDEIIAKYTAADQQSKFELIGSPKLPKNVKTEDVNWKKFKSDWEALTDIHQFDPLLRKYKVSRLQAYKNIGRDWAYQLSAKALRECFDKAVETQTPIMLFAGNKGCIQINTAVIENVKKMGSWLNILDEGNDVHIKKKDIKEVWLSKRPMEHECGYVTCVDCFNEKGETVLTIFGKRREKLPELEAWRDIAFSLPKAI